MKRLAPLILALSCAYASAQNLSQPILQPHFNLPDANGNPCAGCSLYSYTVGSTTPKPTYTSPVIPGPQNTNPIVLDPAGGGTAWLDLNGYKFVLKDANGATIWTVDNVTSIAALGCLGNNQISKGCTGATTSQGAATNIVDGNNIKPATVLNSNVNSVYTVTKYGAVGDCTPSGSVLTSNVNSPGAACTDNTAAFQAAIDAAYATGGSVYVPINPTAPSNTVYYLASAVNPEGVSIYADLGSQGQMQSFSDTIKVALRGAPGKDILHIVQTGGSGFVLPWSSFTIANLGFIVDATTNASSSFSTRLPGRSCNDVAATGTAVITSAAQCEFQPGDVGQNIKVGATTTTILSFQSSTQVTLNATVTTGTNIATYISMGDLSVTQSVGNCAFAMDDPNAAYAGAFNMDFKNLNITSNNPNSGNYQCGLFFQGAGADYEGNFDNVYIGLQFGIVAVPAVGAAESNTTFAGLGDHNHFTNMWLECLYPWITYDGGAEEIRNLKISTYGYGPQILSAYSVEVEPTSWKIDIPESEYIGGSCSSTQTGFRISGRDHDFGILSLAMCSPQTIQWDANDTIAQHFTINNAGAFNLTGYMNSLLSPDFANSFDAATYNVTGFGNILTTGRSTNPFTGVQSGRRQFAYNGASAFGPPNLSRGAIALNRTHDFISHGASNYYFNDEDLWFWPQELINGVANSPPTLAADTDSPTSENFIVTTSRSQTVSGSNGTSWYISSTAGNGQFPAGKMRVYVLAKAASASNMTITGQAFYSAAWHSIGTSTTSVSSASYAVYSADIDATGLGGDQLRIDLSTDTTDTYVGWIGVRVYDTAPYGDYSSTIAHKIVALWNGASGVLVDDAEGGSGYQSGSVAWGTTITGTYYVDCFTTGWTSGGTLGAKIVATAVGAPVDGSNFQYGVDVATIAAARGSTIPSVTCMAIQ